MVERAGVFKEWGRDFFLDEQKLRKIHDVFREKAGKLSGPTFIKFHVERDNDYFYDTTDIEEVLKDDNAAGRAIRTLGVALHKKSVPEAQDEARQDPEKVLAIVAFRSFSTEKVLLQVQHEQRDWSFVLADDLDSQIQRIVRKRALLGLFPLLILDVTMYIFITCAL